MGDSSPWRSPSSACVVLVRLLLDWRAAGVDWAILASPRRRRRRGRPPSPGRPRARDRDRRDEAESFARILSGLSRSVSPDAILDAIVDELGDATGADHIVVVRRRPGRAGPRGDPHQRPAGRPGLDDHPADRRPEDRLDTDAVASRDVGPVAVPIVAEALPAASSGPRRRRGSRGVRWRRPDPAAAFNVPAPSARRHCAGFTSRIGARTRSQRRTARSRANARRAPDQLIAERIAARVRRDLRPAATRWPRR